MAKFNTVTDSVETVLDLSSRYHLGNMNVEQIIADKNGLIWLFIANKGIMAYRSNLKNEVVSIPRSELNVSADAELNFKSVKKDKSGDLIVGTSAGLKFISVNEHKPVTSKNFASNPFNSIINYSVNAIADYKGGLIIGTTAGLFRCDCQSNIFQQILPAIEVNDLDWFNTASAIYCSNENIWIGSQFGVALVKKVDIPFTSYFSSFNGNNTRIRHAVNLLALNDSVFYSCGTDGFYKVNLTDAFIEKYGRNEPYYFFLKLPGNYIIAGGKNGMDLMTTDGKALNISDIFPELSAIKNDFLTAALQYNDSLFLMGSENQKGMYVWNIKKRTIDIINTQTKPLHLKSNVINSFYATRDKKVLILCDNQVSVYDPLKKSIDHPDILNPKTKEALNIIMDVCEVGNDYYFAVYGVGIVCTDTAFKIKKIYADNEGLHNTGLYEIFSVGDTSVITSSNNGLALLNTKKNKIAMYYESDGLQSSSFEEKSGYKKGDIIFMGGINGFTRIDPSKFIANTTPPVLYFTRIQTKIKDNPIDLDTINLQMDEYTIGNKWLQTNIYFTGLNYQNQERVTYQYRIKGQNTSWVNLGNQNFVSLLGLSPGAYVLEVKAANEDGYWCQPKQLTLIFQPKWYQTWLFNIFAGFFVAFLLYAFYRYRLTQLRKQHQIRKEIAGDLHDDIGATLNSVKIFTHLAETAPEKQKYFTLITDALSQASIGLRDMIWVLDDEGDTAGDLLKRLQAFSHPVAEATGIKVNFSADGAGNIILNKTEKRNLLLIAKEAINNSIKYAGCKNILVVFTRV
ncbi:MAG: triple tyrosine motif-containing protein, partial [Panacibacter sp.]